MRGTDEAAEAADRSLAGALAALGVRAVRPTTAAKEWAWSRLRDDSELSNYAALALAEGFWVTPDPDLVRPWVDQVGDLVVGLSARMGDDALSRVVTAIHPTRLVDDATATASTAMLAPSSVAQRSEVTVPGAPSVRTSVTTAPVTTRTCGSSRGSRSVEVAAGPRPKTRSSRSAPPGVGGRGRSGSRLAPARAKAGIPKRAQASR